MRQHGSRRKMVLEVCVEQAAASSVRLIVRRGLNSLRFLGTGQLHMMVQLLGVVYSLWISCTLVHIR